MSRIVMWRMAAAGALPMAVLLVLLGVIVLSSQDRPQPNLGGCSPTGNLTVDPGTVPVGPVAGYSGAQLATPR